MFGRMMFASGGVVNPLPGGNFVWASSPSVQSTVRFNTDGTVDHVTTGGSSSFAHLWHEGGGDASLFIRFTLVSGDTPNVGTLGTWQQLNAAQSIGYTHSSAGVTRAGTIKVDIATDSGGSNIIASSTGSHYYIEAEVPI